MTYIIASIHPLLSNRLQSAVENKVVEASSKSIGFLLTEYFRSFCLILISFKMYINRPNLGAGNSQWFLSK